MIGSVIPLKLRDHFPGPIYNENFTNLSKVSKNTPDLGAFMRSCFLSKITKITKNELKLKQRNSQLKSKKTAKMHPKNGLRTPDFGVFS